MIYREIFIFLSIIILQLFIVDLIYMEEIDIFKTENHDGTVRLTSDQKAALDNMLKEDIKFNETFSDYEWLGNYANTLVDCYGNIYYEIGLGKGTSTDIGKILLLFDYNKLTHRFDLVDYMYIPDYVNKAE